jgi:hypothetical protein
LLFGEISYKLNSEYAHIAEERPVALREMTYGKGTFSNTVRRLLSPSFKFPCRRESTQSNASSSSAPILFFPQGKH